MCRRSEVLSGISTSSSSFLLLPVRYVSQAGAPEILAVAWLPYLGVKQKSAETKLGPALDFGASSGAKPLVMRLGVGLEQTQPLSLPSKFRFQAHKRNS